MSACSDSRRTETAICEIARGALWELSPYLLSREVQNWLHGVQASSAKVGDIALHANGFQPLRNGSIRDTIRSTAAGEPERYPKHRWNFSLARQEAQMTASLAREQEPSARSKPTHLFSAQCNQTAQASGYVCPVSPWETDYFYPLHIHIQDASCQPALLASPLLLLKPGGKKFPVNFSPSLRQSAYLGSKSATDRRRWGLEMKCCSCAWISWNWGLLIRSCDQQFFMSS